RDGEGSAEGAAAVGAAAAVAELREHPRSPCGRARGCSAGQRLAAGGGGFGTAPAVRDDPSQRFDILVRIAAIPGQGAHHTPVSAAGGTIPLEQRPRWRAAVRTLRR